MSGASEVLGRVKAARCLLTRPVGGESILNFEVGPENVLIQSLLKLFYVIKVIEFEIVGILVWINGWTLFLKMICFGLSGLLVSWIHLKADSSIISLSGDIHNPCGRCKQLSSDLIAAGAQSRPQLSGGPPHGTGRFTSATMEPAKIYHELLGTCKHPAQWRLAC